MSEKNYEQIEKNLKMRRKVDNVRTTKFSIPFGPVEARVEKVEKTSNDESIILHLSVKDSSLLSTKDDRKVDSNGAKYSNIRIFYIKKEINEIPIDFLRKNDIITISGKFAQGYDIVHREDDVRKKLKDKGRSEDFIEQFIADSKELGTIDEYKTKMHYYGIETHGTRLTEETRSAIEEYKKSLYSNIDNDASKTSAQTNVANNNANTEAEKSTPSVSSTNPQVTEEAKSNTSEKETPAIVQNNDQQKVTEAPTNNPTVTTEPPMSNEAAVSSNQHKDTSKTEPNKPNNQPSNTTDLGGANFVW